MGFPISEEKELKSVPMFGDVPPLEVYDRDPQAGKPKAQAPKAAPAMPSKQAPKLPPNPFDLGFNGKQDRRTPEYHRLMAWRLVFLFGSCLTTILFVASFVPDRYLALKSVIVSVVALGVLFEVGMNRLKAVQEIDPRNGTAWAIIVFDAGINAGGLWNVVLLIEHAPPVRMLLDVLGGQTIALWVKFVVAFVFGFMLSYGHIWLKKLAERIDSMSKERQHAKHFKR